MKMNNYYRKGYTIFNVIIKIAITYQFWPLFKAIFRAIPHFLSFSYFKYFSIEIFIKKTENSNMFSELFKYLFE